ncbi:MAG: hypothetical protein KatS3mg102_2753 [Planctomycetota bacterium]|nr:MAG: hypothetical protein KatS3mg102_2753 [Planctomycetota bacterium]
MRPERSTGAGTALPLCGERLYFFTAGRDTVAGSHTPAASRET